MCRLENPDVPIGLQLAANRGLIEENDLRRATYYTGHETIIASRRYPGMAHWRKDIFAFMHHNAQRPRVYFKNPSSQIMEVGIEFEI
jgi:KUP system potassium uptake protein